MRGPIPPPPSRQRLPAAARRREIVAAVLDLARERGPDAITTQAIAERIGVTQGAVFRHFPHKEAIWLAVFAWVRESLDAAFATALGAARSPLDKLEQAFVAHVAFLAAHPGVPRVLFHELQLPGDTPVRVAVRAMIADYGQGLVKLVEQAKASGQLPPGLDATTASVLFVGAVQGLVIHAMLTGDEAAMAERARRTWPLLVHGYRGREAPR
jgi:AcrR family transcriptional regulator